MIYFEALAACIRSGQIPEHHVPQLMRDNPAFAEFYRDNALGIPVNNRADTEGEKQ